MERIIFWAMLFTWSTPGYSDSGTENFRRLHRVEVIDRIRSGPTDYFGTYNSTRTTVIRHGKMRVRLSGGEELVLNNPMYTLDLGDLTGFGKGLVLSLKDVPFPAGRSEIDIAEVWVDLEPDAATSVTFADATTCDLRVPNRLHFFMPVPFLAQAEDYYLKVAFSPLADVRIERVVKTSQEFLCPTKNWEPICVPIGAAEVKENLNCALSSDRLPITGVVRRSDEF